MKKIVAMLLALMMMGCCAACAEAPAVEIEAKSEGVMTYAEYVAAGTDVKVTVECYVQATQAWWDNAIVVYAADQEGAYYIYNMACSKEDAEKLVPGTKIKVTGFTAEYAGEYEILDSTFEFVEGGINYIAEPIDLTEKLGTDELINYQNQLATFKGMTVKAINYKNGEPGDDVYVTLTKGEADYDFCVECYLTGPETELYKTVQALQVGDVVDVTGFAYWYNGINTHITAVTK